ncbi:response regulator transcription factor [Dyella choica]|uniref:Response regulator transcription factor n=1 Tax=Dyella choica TaxID=1927959 RepID=A0A3S0RLH5_9GAMM|nr:response regulator transcription factor [Dyella choica]RUL76865.1 response regulator transcription factor [Dyella choica]
MKFAHDRPLPDGSPIRVVIADDHPLTLAGLLYELQGQRSFQIVDSAISSTGLVESLEKHAIDVVISDYAMPGGRHGDGIMLFGLLRQRFPNVGLVALTMMSHADVIRSLLAQGVNCIISKADPLEYLTTAAYAALAGKRYLSPSIEAIVQRHGIQGGQSSRGRHLSIRELEVVRLFVSGFTISEIAHRLQRCKQTVSTQKMSAMRKLSIRRDVDLIKYGIDEKLTSQGIETHLQAKLLPASSIPQS